MPMRGELSVPAIRMGGAVGARVGRQLADAVAPDLVKVAAFCLLGLVVTLVLMYAFPDAGELIAASNIYP